MFCIVQRCSASPAGNLETAGASGICCEEKRVGAMVDVLVWLAIVLGVCWLLLKLFGRPGRRKRGPEERSDNPFRK